MTDKTAIMIKLSTAQVEALNEAASKAGHNNRSAGIRQGMKWWCRMHGIEWPDDVREYTKADDRS